MVKKQFICTLLLLLFGTSAQTWEYLRFPVNNDIVDITVKKDHIWAETSIGDAFKLDLDGKLQKYGTSDSLGDRFPHQNLYFNDIVYCTLNQKAVALRSPLDDNNGRISSVGYDSQSNIYFLATNTIWKYDGQQWSQTQIKFPQDEDHIMPNFEGDYTFFIDKNDCLWGEVRMYFNGGSVVEYFWIDLKTSALKYRADNIDLEHIVVDYYNNNKLIAGRGEFYIVEGDDLTNISDTILIPAEIKQQVQSEWFYVVDVNTDASGTIVHLNAGYNIVMYDGHNWEVFDLIKSENYRSKEKDGEGRSWRVTGRQLFRNDGVKIDTITFVEPNDSLNSCYQNEIKRYTDATLYGNTKMFKDQRGNTLLYKNKMMEKWGSLMESPYPQFCIDPLTCSNTIGEYHQIESVLDRKGHFWRFKTTETSGGFKAPYTHDTIALQLYEQGVFKNMYEYKDFTKPILSMPLLDASGTFWGIYGEGFFAQYGYKGQLINRGYARTKLILFNGSWIDLGYLDDQVKTCIKGNNDDVWVLSKTKLRHFKGGAFETYPLPASFEDATIVCDQKGVIWYANLNGYTSTLYRFDGDSWVLCNVEATSASICAGYEGVWVWGTNNGVFYSNDGLTWTHYTQQNGLLDDNVTNVLVDKQRSIWIQSERGISKFITNATLSADADQQMESDEMHVYPNPAQSKIYINGLYSNPIISIHDLNGVLLKRGVDVNEMDVSDLQQGMYMLKVQHDATVKTAPFIKE